MRAPKNSTSVARKAHIPSVTASRCWTRVAYWKLRAPASDMFRLHAWLALIVLVRRPDHGRRHGEILRWRRRRDRPFKARGIPGICRGSRALQDRPEKIEQRERVADREDARAGRRQHMPDLELGR